MKVEVKHIDPHLLGIDDSHDSIHVSPLAVDKPAPGMNNVGYFLDVLFEKTKSIRIGHHDAGSVFVHQPGDTLDRNNAFFIRGDMNRFIAAKSSACGVGAVSCVRDNDFLGVSPLAPVVGMNEKHSCELTVSPCRRLKGNRVHSGDPSQVFFKMP